MNAKTFATIALIFIAGAASAQQRVASEANAAESVEIANHTVFNTNEVVDGATILVRDFVNNVVRAQISTQALQANTAYSVWWAIFNRPQFCREPYECAVGDLEVMGGDPRVRASVFWAGGFVSDDFGTANVNLTLTPGRTTRELFAKSKPYGLRNFKNAEIHAVLRTHGPTGIAGTVAEQIGTATLACPEGGCQNVFASIHAPTRDE